MQESQHPIQQSPELLRSNRAEPSRGFDQESRAPQIRKRPAAAATGNGPVVLAEKQSVLSRASEGEHSLLIERARHYLASAPPSVSGERGHDRCFAVVCALLHRFGLSSHDAMALLLEWNKRCIPPWGKYELQHKIQSAQAVPQRREPFARARAGRAHRASRGSSAYSVRATRVVPEFDPVKLAVLAKKAGYVDEQWLGSVSPLRPDTRTPASFLHVLYEPGEQVLIFDVFGSQGQHLWKCQAPPFDARELDGFRRGKPNGVWFLTNPVDGKWKQNDTCNRSRRSWQNITAFRYLLLESDQADPAHWLRALVQMPLRIATIYTSGGKSIHALVRLDAASREEWNEAAARLKPILTLLGADPKSMSAVRLSRLPGCQRGEPDRLQRLLYLNPTPEAAPILTICEGRKP